jgi:hypothetical protein
MINAEGISETPQNMGSVIAMAVTKALTHRISERLSGGNLGNAS